MEDSGHSSVTDNQDFNDANNVKTSLCETDLEGSDRAHQDPNKSQGSETNASSVGPPPQSTGDIISAAQIEQAPLAAGQGQDVEDLRREPSEPLFSVFTLPQKRYIVFMASFGGFFSPLSANIYLPALNALSTDLHVSNSIINLTLTSYMIFQGLAPTIFGDLGDMIGRRPVYILSFIIYLGANLGLALQTNYAALFVLRCVQSTGSSGTVALGNGVIADIATSGERGTYIGYAVSGPMVAPAIAPVIGGILTEFLGWRAIFWFLAIMGVVYLIPFIITFPETCRNVVGNGSIPAQKWNVSLLNYLQVRKYSRQHNKLPRERPTQERTAAQVEQASKRKLRWPNPLRAIRIIFEKDVGIVLFYTGIINVAFYDVTATIPSLFAEIYSFNNLQVGLCYIPFGVGCACASIIAGHFMDWNYRRVARNAGFRVDLKRGDDMQHFPLEKAHIQVIYPMIYFGIAAILCYGWVLEKNAPLAAPLILHFIIGLTLTGGFNVMSTILIDLYPMSASTATAASNLVRCWMGAAGTAIIAEMINGMGRGWCFTFVAAVMFLASGLLRVEEKWGPGWREDRRVRMGKEKRRKIQVAVVEAPRDERITAVDRSYLTKVSGLRDANSAFLQQPPFHKSCSMDFWSRLIGGVSTAPKSIKGQDPAQRLVNFKKIYDQVLAWRKSQTSSSDSQNAENVRILLQQLNRILQAESQASPPHLCFQHVAQAQLYTQLSQLAASLLDNPIVHEVLEIFNTLIEYEDDDFLGIQDFADDVARMAHTTSASGTLMEESTHVMVEMLFGIAAKIKHHPSYLQVWFRPKPESNEQHQWEASKKPRSSSDKQTFPLFYYFLNYIHLDITAGEFSRTGLIYIVEAADCDEALERWIIESDLATLMASGLGALYSQLSRKLVVAHGDDPVPAVYALSEGHRSIPKKATVPSPSKIDQDLRSFLVFLAFWQDILEYCKSADVRQTLLDHFEHIFMQQVLYPSMLESSDKDGGSSVAILTYIRLIVESVTYPDLIRVFLRFLLANRTPPAMETGNKSARPAALARRRKSQNLLEEEERSQNRLIPDLFSLIDLVLSSLRSGDQQTVAGTLQLVSALLQTQYTYVMSSLLRAQNVIPGSVKYSLEMHEKNLDDLDRLAARLFNFEEPSESTESHRQDAEHLIEMHCTTDSTLQFPSRLDGDPSLIPTHIIPSQSPFLYCLLSLLEHFFLRDISTNLFLTQTIVVLACCGRSSLKGWLLTDYDTSEEPSPAQAANAGSPNNLTASSPLPSLEASLTHQNSTSTSPSHSALIAALDHLVTQVSTFRAQITDFDAHLSEQKHAFNVWDQMARVTKTISQLKSTESSTQSDPVSNAKSHTNPIPSRLRTSKQSSLSPSRSGSPRGRRSAELPFTGGFTSLTGRLGQLRVSASPSPLRFDQRARRSPSDVSPTRQVREAIGGEQRLLTVDGGMIPHKMVEVPVSGGLYGNEADGEKEVLLSQVLTNVIILHDFILELMAVVEVRASLFGEVVM